MRKDGTKIFMLVGHSDRTSLTHQISAAYVDGACSQGHEVRIQSLADMKFERIHHSGYHGAQPLEPDLVDSKANILWSNHWIIVHPLWWGSAHAILKGLIDRILLPGFAFKYEKGKIPPKKLLNKRSARVVIVSDTPTWCLYLTYGAG